MARIQANLVANNQYDIKNYMDENSTLAQNLRSDRISATKFAMGDNRLMSRLSLQGVEDRIDEEESNYGTTYPANQEENNNYSHAPGSNVPLRQSKTHEMHTVNKSRNLHKELIMKTADQVLNEGTMKNKFKKVEHGKYDINTMFKTDHDKQNLIDKANTDVKEVMFQMLYDDYKFGLAEKEQKIYEETI